jgi:transposase InsO family protein
VHAVLVRCRINRLTLLDRRTGEPVLRYERDRPGELVHTDVKKLGNIPTGGGWRTVGRAQGGRNRAADGGKGRSRRRNVLMGHAYVHTAVDDHTRLAYAEVHDDETAATAIGFWRRAVAWFAARGVTVERVLSDNGSCYRSRTWRQACAELGITPKYTRAYRPQTNGKAERFNRTMINEWAFARPYPNKAARRTALPTWLHHYNGDLYESSQQRWSAACREDLSELLGWGCPSEASAGSIVELFRDSGEVGCVVGAEIGAFREVLTQQAVEVLVAAALPWAARLAEVDRHPGGGAELVMTAHLAALVPGQRSCEITG